MYRPIQQATHICECFHSPVCGAHTWVSTLCVCVLEFVIKHCTRRRRRRVRANARTRKPFGIGSAGLINKHTRLSFAVGLDIASTCGRILAALPSVLAVSVSDLARSLSAAAATSRE